MKDRTAWTELLRFAGLLAVVALPACAGGERSAAPEVVIRGTDPVTAAPTDAPVSLPATTADPRGVVDYGDYKVVIAQGGETVADLAQQVGLSAAELAAHNGLTPAHTMRAGDELVLPVGPGVPADSGTVLAAAEPVRNGMIGTAPVESTIETAPLSDAVIDTNPIAPTEPEPIPGVMSDGQPADPAVAASEPSQSGAWSPDLAAAAIERSSGVNAGNRLGAPPSASEPIPPEPPARQELASPDLGQYQTGAAGSPLPPAVPDATSVTAPDAGAAPSQDLTLLRPVEGPVAVAFNKSPGSERNDGVDFAAPAGAPVIAAADGEVALVSPALGGLGTIVLLRHSNGLLTVYGRIDGVTVQKGDIVQAGQRIGAVSNATAPAEPRLHFEVRRGAESLDPMQFL